MAPAVANADGSLRVLSAGSPNSSSAVWYRTPLPVASGFRTEFDVTITPGAPGGAEGVAFVLQAQSPETRGASGANLGYGGISASVAFELDTHVDATENDPAYQHIGVHTGYASPNSANELSAIAETGSEFRSIARGPSRSSPSRC
jgi:hypothetical protein